MKPSPFDYQAPETLDELLDLLAESGDDASLIAGGQSLVPLLNLRLARPELILDPRRIKKLVDFEISDKGFRAGAMTRVADVEADSSAGSISGLLSSLRQIAHSQIRARTTFGGSIAHADPAAELPALLVALEGEVTLISRDRGTRSASGSDFFLGPLMTDRQPDELVSSIWFPSYEGKIIVNEVVDRPGDFAIVGAMAGYALEVGNIVNARIVVFGVAGVPIRLQEIEVLLNGEPPNDDLVAHAAAQVHEFLDPQGDIHGSAEYRRHLASTLVHRCLRGAA